MFRPQLPTLLADSTWSAPTPLMGAHAGRPWSRSPRHWAHMQFTLRTSSGNRLTWPSSQVMVTACLRSTSIVTGSTTRTSHTATVHAPAFGIPSNDPNSVANSEHRSLSRLQQSDHVFATARAGENLGSAAIDPRG